MKEEQFMGNNKFDAKDIIAGMEDFEKERQIEIEKLARELDELENSKIKDNERIDAIVKELNIINPLPENDTYENFKKISQARVKPKKRKWKILLRVSAAIIAVFLSAHIISTAAFDRDFFGDVINWTRDMFSSIMGVNMQEDDHNVLVSETRTYATVEELKKAENIDILIPIYLPYEVNVEYIEYSYSNDMEKVEIRYNDKLTFLKIHLNTNINKQNIDDPKEYMNNQVVYYIYQNSNMILWEYNNNSYYLTCGFAIEDYENIIKSIK